MPSVGRSWGRYVPGSLAKRFMGSYADLARQAAKEKQIKLIASAANAMFGATASQAQLASVLAINAATERTTKSALDIFA